MDEHEALSLIPSNAKKRKGQKNNQMVRVFLHQVTGM
jgi:hypothetical protein